MKLQDFLGLIVDEELRIELEIDVEGAAYSYTSFWLSDYRIGNDIAKCYKDCEVENISLLTDVEDIIVTIKQKN